MIPSLISDRNPMFKNKLQLLEEKNRLISLRQNAWIRAIKRASPFKQFNASICEKHFISGSQNFINKSEYYQV